MNREQYVKFAKEKLVEHKLADWHIRLNPNPDARYVGLCSYKDKTIILNAHHCDIHPEPEVINTILHEIAHALCPGMGHNNIWADKARALGCDNTLPCLTYGLPPAIIDAIRSGANVDITFDEQVIRTPKYVVTQIAERCPECGKVAKEKNSFQIVDKDGNDCKFTILECQHIIKKILPKATPFSTLVRNWWKDEIKNCKHEWTKGVQSNQCSKCGEFKLFNFQVEGCQFAERALAYNKGVLIADQMGLGKTVQALGQLHFHPELFPVLFVVKSGLKYQFSREILAWLGHISQVIETGQHYIFPNLKCYIISYDLIRRLDTRARSAIEKIGIKTVVLDECQQIKNPDSSRTHGVRNLAKNAKVMALSGTPWKNRGSEFFPVLNMLDPIKFHSHIAFLNRWVDYYYEGPRRKEGGLKDIPGFKEYTKEIVIRRERKDVMSEIPPTTRVKLYFQLDEMEQATYDDEVSDFVKWYNDYVMSGEEDQIDGLELLAKMSRMRHIVGLAKIPATLGYVEEFVDDEDDKLVIFAHHIDVQELLYNKLKETYRDRPVYWLKGGLDAGVRFDIQEKFNKSRNALMVASQLAAGEGLNLQTCHTCVMHERQWNPGNEEQAEDRFARIGQESNVITANYAEAAETIDSMFDEIVEKKRRQFHAAMNSGEVLQWDTTSIGKELAQKIVEKYNKDRSKKQNITAKVRIKK